MVFPEFETRCKDFSGWGVDDSVLSRVLEEIRDAFSKAKDELRRIVKKAQLVTLREKSTNESKDAVLTLRQLIFRESNSFISRDMAYVPNLFSTPKPYEVN